MNSTLHTAIDLNKWIFQDKMNEDACQQVITTPASRKMSFSWQTGLIVMGVIVLLLFMSYLFYRFVRHTNNKFKLLEQAIHKLNKPPQVQPQVHSPPIFASMDKPSSILFPPVSMPIPVPPPPPPTPVVVDTKVLDKELTEELKELNKVEEPEGRVEEKQLEDPPSS